MNIAVEKLLQIADSSVPFSDFLISAGDPVMVKNASGWFPTEMEGFSLMDVDDLLTHVDPNWSKSLFAGRISRTHETQNWRLRVSAYMAFAGTRPMLAVRRTPRYPIPLNETGLPQQIRLMADIPRGLIIVSGATGSGKTTTTAAIIDTINDNRRAHIVTIEDPIEYQFKPKKSFFSQREVGVDTPTFYEGVRGAMRQSPDVILIGEIRDRDTAETALLAGESGHLVLATLHANSAYGAVQKLLSFFPGESSERLSSLQTSLAGVIHQVMIPKIDNVTSAVATELLFNHKQQASAHLGSAAKINEMLDKGDDGVSVSLVKSMVSLVKSGTVSSSDALRAVIGQGFVYDKLKQSLQV